MLPDVRPLMREQAVDDRVAHAAVPALSVMTDHAILLRTEPFDRSLRSKVEVVRPETDDAALQDIERMLEQQQLARGVDVSALQRLRVPRVADLDAIDLRHDVVIARAAGNLSFHENGPRQHVTFTLTLERLVDVTRDLIGLRHRR